MGEMSHRLFRESQLLNLFSHLLKIIVGIIKFCSHIAAGRAYLPTLNSV